MAISVAQLLKRVGTGLTAEIVIMKLLSHGVRRSQRQTDR